MNKLYEVYFTLEEPASVVIAARDENEAEEIFEQMTRKELLERIANALEMGVEITEIEDLNEEDE
jgi:DNA-binding transcriptional regulator YhcF (GntR family)